MGRWEPDARGRLERAALELYGERGFDRTTVADITERAGLTQRTFFRYFADKREVLFHGQDALLAACVTAIAGAPDSATPMEAVATALDASARLLADRREPARRRREVITANPGLRERELLKLATLAGAMADALRGRGVPDPDAALAAEAGIAVFKVAFTRWLADPRPLTELVRESLDGLRTVTAPSASHT